MIPYRAMWSNADFAKTVLGDVVKPGDNIISILPMAHMYGMAFEFLYEFITGAHVYFLTRMPSPAIIAQALSEVKPIIMIAVPLVIEKIIRKRVFPKIQNNKMKVLLNTPLISNKVKAKICEQVYNAFGGNLYQIIIGGAALNQEIEKFLRSINFPFTVGYGATECAPIISYSDWKTFILTSCGRAAVHQEVSIDSSDPENIPGEIITKGLNVMLGYYKNPDDTKHAIDSEGWYHTGDLGTMDSAGNIFIKGRSKNMLLGSNGQNIYPEEIEDKLSSLPLVNECLVIQREEKLIGLVYPDIDEAKAQSFNQDDIIKIMNENKQQLNTVLPNYCKISDIEIMEKEFEKTPKKSIKRYMYK